MLDIHDLYQKAKAGELSNNNLAVGWTCIYTPEELIYAADLLPYRVVGHMESTTPMADQHLQPNICGFARSCLDTALKGHYAFLQGMVMSHTCDTFCKLCDIWREQVRPPYFFQLNTPHRNGRTAQEFFAKELRKFKDSLSEFYKVEITDSEIERAIAVYNTNRALLKRINEFRKLNPPLITGVEALKLVLMGMMIPKDVHNRLLSELAYELELSSRKTSIKPYLRFMITGGPLDDPTLIELIEECGATVVCEDVCTGTRYYWDLVEPDMDPFMALSKRYLSKVPCPCMHPSDRWDHLYYLTSQFNVDGIMIYSLKFCDTHLHEIPSLQDKIRRMELPCLILETDHSAISISQLKTRIQAFVEFVNEQKGRK